MKPKKKIEIIKRTYWSCTNAKHRHKTNITAQECIDKHISPRKKYNSWKDENMEIVLSEVRSGSTDEYFKKKYSISNMRCTWLRNKAKQYERWRNEDIDWYLGEIVSYGHDLLKLLVESNLIEPPQKVTNPAA